MMQAWSALSIPGQGMQIAKSHRYVSASGPTDRQIALAVAENEGWRIPPATPATRKRTSGRFTQARGPIVRVRDFGYGDHG